MDNTSDNCNLTAAEHISLQISNLKDWRGKTLTQIRNLILKAEPGISEEWKWGTAVWTKGGTICCAIPYKNRIQINFFKGASLVDSNGLFNAETDGRVSRAIDFRKGRLINEVAFMELVREAVTFNQLGDLFSTEASTRQQLITQT